MIQTPVLQVAFTLLLFGATLGLYLAYRHLRHQPPELRVALLHGPFGIIALGILMLSLFRGELRHLMPFPYIIALPLLGVGALVGLLMFIGHKAGRKVPALVIIIHAILGITALALVGKAAGIL